MEFERPVVTKTPSYMDSLDPGFSYMESSAINDYLQYPPSPSYEHSSMDLPGSPASFSGLHNLSLSHGIGDSYYGSSSPNATPMHAPTPSPFNPPTRPYTPLDTGIAPPTLTGPSGSYTLSAGEMSSDSLTSGRRSRGGSHSPPASIPYAATVPRSHRYNPIAAPATRSSARAGPQRRRATRHQDDSDEDDDDFQPISHTSGSPLAGGSADSRRETIRKQRIESEQRRRDELRDGYARLKDTLPPSNQKSSKVSLLDRATQHVRQLEKAKEHLENRLREVSSELSHVREVNNMLVMRAANNPHGIQAPTLVPGSTF